MDRKRFLLPMLLGVLFLALALASPVYADDPPPPEQPAVAATPPVVALEPGQTGEDVEREGAAPAAELEQLDIYAAPTENIAYFKQGSSYFIFIPTADDCANHPYAFLCTESDTPIQAALDDIQANERVPSDRIIYVEKGIYNESTAGVVINGLGDAYLAQLKGLKGAGSSNTLTTLADTSHVNTWVKVTGSTAGFTLSGFNITGSNAAGVLNLVELSGATGAVALSDLLLAKGTSPETLVGLNVTTNGSITLDAVTAFAMPSEGARLTSTAASGSYGVKISNSSFNKNLVDWDAGTTASLLISSAKAVQLYGVSASMNEGTGLRVTTAGGLTIENSAFIGNTNPEAFLAMGDGVFSSGSSGTVSIKNTVLSDNDGYGIYIDGHSGDVTIQDSQVILNTMTGIRIDTCNASGSTCLSTAAGKVTIKNTQVLGNDEIGIYINQAKGNVLLDGVTAKGNTYEGAKIIATYAAAATVTVYRSIFNDNGIGLDIDTKGTITLNAVSASLNMAGNGARLDNDSGTGSISILSSYGANTFSNNGLRGLDIYSNNKVSLDMVTASLNGTFNARIDADAGSGTISVTRSVFNDGDYGLYIYAGNTITFNNVTADGNQDGHGASLSCNHTTAGVSILSSMGVNSFQGNDSSGIVVEINGSLTASDITASDNVNYGISGAVGGSASITRGIFNNNDYGGIQLEVAGKVTLNTIAASGNQVHGVFIDNDPGTGVSLTLVNASDNDALNPAIMIISGGSVMLTNCDAARNNIGYGLSINTTSGSGSITISNTRSGVFSDFSLNNGTNIDLATNGSVTIKVVDASASFSGIGLDLSQESALSGGVSISGSRFDRNGLWGLYVNAKRAVTITTSTANSNIGPGAYINNNTGTGNISITSVTFNGNGGKGLDIISAGSVTLSQVNANGTLNGDDGAVISNATGSGNVTISGSSSQNTTFDANTGKGLIILTAGSVTLKYISASHNLGSNGALIDNLAGSSSICLTSAYFDANRLYNLDINTSGKVTYTTGSASDSPQGYGAEIDNILQDSSQVTITGVNFDGNSTHGLKVVALGAITLSKCNANGNGPAGYGIQLENNGTSVTAGISVTGTSSSAYAQFSDNSGTGMKLYTNGTVTLKYIDASGNHDESDAHYGAYIEGGAGAVSFTGVTLDENRYGLYLTTTGKVTYTTGSVSGNEMSGIYIDNHLSGLAASSVTLSSVSANGNEGGMGISIRSYGAISLTNSNASGNIADVGAEVVNSYGTDGVTVKYSSSSGYSLFNDNGSDGLVITTLGAVTLSRIQASRNADNGLQINGTGAVGTASLTTIYADENAYSNVTIIYDGSLNWKTGTANNSTNGSGISIDADAGSGTVSLSSITANGNLSNSKFGLYLTAAGAVTLNNITASENWYGCRVDNTVNESTVTVTNSLGTNTFFQNEVYGLNITAKGNTAITGVTSLNNGTSGIYINLTGASNTVSVQKSTLNYNADPGLYIITTGAVTLTSLSVIGNGDQGGANDGINITTSEDAVTVTSSYITGNGRYGVYASIGSATLTLKSTYYLGNATLSGSENLFGTGGLVIQ